MTTLCSSGGAIGLLVSWYSERVRRWWESRIYETLQSGVDVGRVGMNAILKRGLSASSTALLCALLSLSVACGSPDNRGSRDNDRVNGSTSTAFPVGADAAGGSAQPSQVTNAALCASILGRKQSGSIPGGCLDELGVINILEAYECPNGAVVWRYSERLGAASGDAFSDPSPPIVGCRVLRDG